MRTKKILIIIGTRPEAIKMAPLILLMLGHTKFNLKVCITAQHRAILDQVLDLFNITPDFDLDIMTPNQSLNDITIAALDGLKSVLNKFNPEIVLVHGDTATTFAGALAAFYKKIKIGHVEAGLRTGDIYSPWPEEANRKLTTAIANYHFAPTDDARNNLLNENVHKNKILVTGNTVIDALFYVTKKLKNDLDLSNKVTNQLHFLDPGKKLILVTCHRRESLDSGLDGICDAINQIASKYPDIQIVYPMHPNPNVKKHVKKLLLSLSNVFLTEPMEYLSFCYLMDSAYMILTDSGGIQEEAPSLGTPVLVMRNISERPEAISSGAIKLVGTDASIIIKNVEDLLSNEDLYAKMSASMNPYGDGTASHKIINFLSELE